MTKRDGGEMSCDEIMKVLSDKTRFAVLESLLSRAQHVQDLNAALQLDPTLLSHHLKVLREAGLVVTKREGKHVLYSIAPDVRVRGKRQSLDFGCCKLEFKPSKGGGKRAA